MNEAFISLKGGVVLRVSLRKLLNLDFFKGFTILSGGDNLDRIVSDINIHDGPEAFAYMTEETFALTTVEDWLSSEEAQKRWIENLYRKGVVGTGVMLRENDEKFIENTRRFAEELDFPVILLDYDLHYTNLINYFNSHIYIENLDKFFSKEEVQESFLNSIGKNFFSKVIALLSHYLKRDILIRANGKDYTNIDHEVLQVILEHQDDWDGELLENIYGDFVRSVRKMSVDTENGQYVWRSYACDGDDFVWIFEPGSVAVEQASLDWIIKKGLSVISVEMRRDADLSNKALEENIRRLLQSEYRDYAEVASDIGKQGYDLQENNIVLYFNTPLRSEEVSRMQLLIRESFIDFEQVLMGNYDKGFVMLLPDKRPQRTALEDFITKTDSLQSFDGNIHVGVGTSISYDRLPRSFDQATEALFWARILNRRSFPYQQMGFLKLLGHEHLEEKIGDYTDEYFAVIRKFDEQRNAELMETLFALIDNSWGVGKTARSLYVHHNTVKYRITQLEVLMGLDLDSVENRLNIEVAYKLRRMFDKPKD